MKKFSCKAEAKLYRAWYEIKRRCFNEYRKEYKDYGGRGITMCEEWKNSFDAFRDYIGLPTDELKTEVDRLDNNGNYEPGNVKFSNRKEQCNNRRSSRFIEHDGKTKTLAQWAEESGNEAGTISFRLASGWPVDMAIFARPDPAASPLGPRKWLTNDLSGNLINGWKVISRSELRKRYFVCRCANGHEREIYASNIKKIRCCCPHQETL